MKILDRHIAHHLIGSILLVALCLLGVDLFFYLINELRFVGQGDYQITTALLFIALTIPRKIYIMFPWSALVGTLLALGTLARHSELIAMRAASISTHRIAWAVIKAALILTVCVAALGEVVSPVTERWAQQKKTIATSGGQALQTQFGTWVRNDNEFIHIGMVLSNGNLKQITRYQFDPEQRLQEISHAETAYKTKEGWMLENVQGTIFTPKAVHTFHQSQRLLPKLLDVEILKAAGVKHLERLSIKHLWQVIHSRSAHELNTQDYELAFWTKIVQPFAILVMVFMAVPFVFGPLRSASMGVKLLTGVLVGFGFHTLNQIFAPLTTVISLPPYLAASIPTLIFFGISHLMMQRAR